MTIIPLFKDLFVCTVAYSDKGLYWPCAEKTATHVLQGLDKINMILPKACNNVVPGGILLFLHTENTPWFFQIEWLFEYSKILTHHHAITVLQIFLYWKCSQRLVSNLLFVWRYPGVAEMFICIFNLDLLLCDLLKCHVLYPAVL